MKLTAVILAKNEEENIGNCIKSLEFCDEVLVIDDGSTDRTVQIAKRNKATVIKSELNSNYANQKNFALTQAKFKWVLFVDADERVSKELKKDIEKVVLEVHNPFLGYLIKRKKYLWGKEMRYGDSRDYLIRLGRKSAGKWVRRVHEYWEVPGRIGKLEGVLLHYPHRTLIEYINHVNYFSDIHALANREEGKRSNLLRILIFPPAKFIQNYFFRLSIMDGIEGFMVSMMMSLHSFLAWSKLWILQKNIG